MIANTQRKRYMILVLEALDSKQNEETVEIAPWYWGEHGDWPVGIRDGNTTKSERGVEYRLMKFIIEFNVACILLAIIHNVVSFLRQVSTNEAMSKVSSRHPSYRQRLQRRGIIPPITPIASTRDALVVYFSLSVANVKMVIHMIEKKKPINRQ